VRLVAGTVRGSSPGKRGAFLLERLVATAGRPARVRALGGARRGEIQLTRLLRSEAVTPGEMIEVAGARTGPRCAGRHVLAIQDTTVVRSQGGGGLYLHAMIALDAEDGAILGAVHGQFLSRSQGKRDTRRIRPIEDKESHRWLAGADRAAEVCARAAKITVIADRESDIYEAFTRRPVNVDLLIRATKDRNLGTSSLFAHLDALPVAARMQLELPAKPGRKARTAMLVLRFASVELRRPRNGVYKDAPASTRVNVVDVREVDAPQGETPVHWRLFTTHPVPNAVEAFEIANLYRRRWAIDIDQAWRLSRLCSGGAVGGPRRNAAPGRRRGADRLQRRDRLGVGAHQDGAFRTAADVAAR
jgi:hypothetical protein